MWVFVAPLLQRFGGYIVLGVVIAVLLGFMAGQNITIKNLRVDIRDLKSQITIASEINEKQAKLINQLTADKGLAERTAAEISKRAVRNKAQANAMLRELQKRIEDAATDDDMLPITDSMRAVLDGLSDRPQSDRGTTR
jgi:hypothetical protein